MGRVFVSWGVPGGDWLKFRLLRSFFGFAESAEDGVILGEWTPDNLVLRVTDQGQPDETVDPTGYHLPPERFVYYSIMLETATDNWVLAGGAIGLSLGTYDTASSLYSLLPAYWQERDAQTTTKFVDGLPDPSGKYSAPLKRFLALFGREFDLLRTEYTSLLWLRDVDRISGNLLPFLASDLGAKDSTNVGLSQLRRLSRNITHIHKVKGTKPGIEGAVSAYTGWGAEASVGRNLMPTDSWNGWLHGSPVFLDVDTVSDPLYDYVEHGLFLKVLSGSAVLNLYTDQEAKHGNQAYFIPVEPNTTYTFSAQVANLAGPAGNIQVGARIYDADMALLTTANGAAAVPARDTYQMRTSTFTTGPTAAFINPYVYQASTTVGTENLYRRAALVKDSTAGTWESARRIDLTLTATRENMVTNPSFEINMNGWYAYSNSTIAQSADQAFVNSKSMKMTPVAAGDMSASTSAGTDVIEGVSYTASAYFYPATTGRSVRVLLLWRDDTDGFHSVTEGNPVAATAGTWNRASVLGVAPPGAAKVRVALLVASAALNEVHYADGVLLEAAPSLRTYFDANRAPADYLWAGTPNDSASLYFRDMLKNEQRLAETLEEYLPKDRYFRLVYHDPTVRTYERNFMRRPETEDGTTSSGTAVMGEAPMGQ